MRTYATILFVLICNLAIAQNTDTPTTIHLVRSNAFRGSACRTDVTFPNQRQFNLSLNSEVNYTVYSKGTIPITIEMLCPASNYSPANTESHQLEITVTDSIKDYYVLYHLDMKTGVAFKQITKSEADFYLSKITNIQKQAENIDLPINNSARTQKNGPNSGTCFAIAKNGYLITNYHVVEGATEITVKGIDGDLSTKYGATLVSADKSNDLALLKIGNKNVVFDSIPFAIRSSGVAQGERIYAFGYPLTKAMGNEIKLTDGIISARSGVEGDISKFQVSAAVQPGNSGGPLIDEQGNVIGVIYAKSTIADAASYAVKASYLETFLKNVDGFEFPNYVNTIKDKPLTDKVAKLRDYIFIVETN